LQRNAAILANSKWNNCLCSKSRFIRLSYTCS